MRQRRNKGEFDDNSSLRKATKILKNVDVYPKLQKEFRVQTQTGAKVSIATGIVMIILFLSELRDYLTVIKTEQMVVDTTISEKLKVNFNISFPSLSCKDAHLNAMDVAGDLQINMHHDVFKRRLDSKGEPIGDGSTTHIGGPPKLDPSYCGSCNGAERPDGEKCCNTCDELKTAYMYHGWGLDKAEAAEQCTRELILAEREAQKGEGCRLYGFMMVNRVAGNFHVALGRTFHRDDRLVHQFMPGEQLTYNSSHIIHALSFGDPYPGMVNSLDGMVEIATHVGSVFQYYVKIIPTIYSDGEEKVITNQHSFTKQRRHIDINGAMSMLPGVFFVYDISAFMVQLGTKSVPFTHFLSKICAILGGMISFAGFVDSYLYHSRSRRRKSGSSSKQAISSLKK